MKTGENEKLGSSESDDVCKGCGDIITSRDYADGYCSGCHCEECGNSLVTDNERGMSLCDDCAQ